MANIKPDLPRDRPAKIKLLKELLSGQKTMQDLIEDTISIQVNISPSPAERAEFDRLRQLQEDWRGDPSQVYFTVDVK